MLGTFWQKNFEKGPIEIDFLTHLRYFQKICLVISRILRNFVTKLCKAMNLVIALFSTTTSININNMCNFFIAKFIKEQIIQEVK